MVRFVTLLVAISIAFVGAPVARAAEVTAALTGVATDGTGNAVSAVKIVVAGPVRRTTFTDAAGVYAFAGLPPGEYSISASKAGYETMLTADVTIASGTSTTLNVSLQTQTLQSLRTIGSVSTTAGRSGFNASGLSVTTLDNAKIVARVQPNLKDIVAELPGVVSTRDSGGRTPNSSFMVRGSQLETKVDIDGHGVSSGVFGTYNTNYANSEIFEQVEVLKGAGLNGPNAGESAVGTINLRTRNLSSRNEWAASVSTDSYRSGHYQYRFNYNFLHDRFTILAARSYQGYLGPDQGITGYNISGAGASGSTGYAGPALVQWSSELSNPYSTVADLIKARYKFSQATWLTGEFLNLTGRYTNQGGSYAINYGSFPVAQCYTKAGAFVGAGSAGCDATSTYNPPALSALVGTTQSFYSYFPRSFVLNQEPQFSAELRTTLGNDTIFLRPYATEIKRFIDGSLEDTTPGYGFKGGTPNGFYQVTNPANCQVTFAAPGPGTAGAKGPCFSSADNYQTPYVGPAVPGFVTVFPTATTAPGCSVATPCYTTPTNQQRNGYFGYNTPFSQPEVDKTRGVTFSYIHPNKENTYSFSADYSTDSTQKYSGDTSTLPSGCFATVANVPNTPTATIGGAVVTNPYYQPNCQIGGVVFATTPRNSLQIPPSINYKLDYSLTGLFQLTQKLQLGVGNYLTVQRLDYQYTDPAAAAAAANFDPSGRFNGAEQAEATLIHGNAPHTHYDPHVQLQYRSSRDLSFRANAGSSITTPYAGVVSGFTRLSVNSGPDGKSDTLTVPNPQLRPETTVAYDLGFDSRLGHSTVVSGDVFLNTIHDVFINYSQTVANLPGRSPSQTIQNSTVNGPLERSYGVELTAQSAPPSGWGYYATTTLQRAYYDGFTPNFYQQLASFVKPPTLPSFVGLINGKQLDSSNGFTGQVPYFKGKLEVNYMFPRQRAYAAFGSVLHGNNNPYGTMPFQTFYANGMLDLGHNLALQLAGENIFNYSVGTTTGNTFYGRGFTPIGERYNPTTQMLEFGPAFGGPNNIVIIKPANFYITLTKKI